MRGLLLLGFSNEEDRFSIYLYSILDNSSYGSGIWKRRFCGIVFIANVPN